MVEILNFLELEDIARSFSICKYWCQQSRGCIADYNSRVVINTQDFDEDFESLLNFINWVTQRMFELNQLQATFADPDHSLVKVIQINLSSYDLRDYFEDENFAEQVTLAFSALFQQIKGAKNSFKKYPNLGKISVAFNQYTRNRSDILNERVCMHLSELISQMQNLAQLETFQIIGHASEELLISMVKFQKLKFLELKNCQYVEGYCLTDMNCNDNLEHLSLKGSYQISFDCMSHLVKSNLNSLHTLIIDGEQLETNQILSVINPLPQSKLKVFRLYFGQNIDDEFLLLIHSKLNQAELSDFKVRKAHHVTAEAFQAFFNSFDANKSLRLKTLNLEECIQLSSESLRIISEKFSNLERLSIQWCSQNVSDLGLRHVLLRCKHLQKLKLTGCKRLTGEALVEIRTYVNSFKNGFKEEDVPEEHRMWFKIVKENDGKTALDSLQFLDFQMCDLVGDDELQKVKEWYPQIKIYNYYKEEI